MKLQGHFAGGWLVSRRILKNKDYSKPKRRKLLLLGSLFGILPDLDYLWYAYQKTGFEYSSDFRHHTWISHTFPFYWIISAIIYIFGIYKDNKNIKEIAKLFAAGTSIHLLQDTIGSGDGIMLLYPFSKKMGGIGLLGLHGNEWEAKYVKSPIFIVELIIRVLALITFIYDLRKNRI